MRDVAITFNVDPSHTDEVTVDYLPFGTRALKLKVVNTAGPTDVPLVLRPANLAQSTGRFAAYADDRRDIWVTWGGGHEGGPCAHGKDIGWQETCAPLARGDSSYTYFHVTHRPETDTGPLSHATLTLFAVAGDTSTPAGRLKINLHTPQAETLHDPVRPDYSTEHNSGQILLRGSQTPTYLSRWWPDPHIEYTEARVPDLSIHYQPVHERPAWPWLRLWRAVGAALVGQPGRLDVQLAGRPIMSITGNVEPALFYQRWIRPELYRFYSSRYVVLRLWFFWLDTGLDVVRHHIHEIPDIERFDLLIDLQEERAVYAGTDLHWREMWGAVQDEPVQAHVGLSAGNLLRMLGQRLEDEFFDLLVIWDETLGERRNPAVALCGELTGHAHCNHQVEPVGEDVVVRGAGLYAKHSPYFDAESVKLDGRLTSGDVRRS